MDGFKEFQGKNLDDAISAACGYFDATRERLEIDIIQDSKTGIFGLVGARKAKIKARRVQLRSAVEDILGRKRDDAPAAEASTENTDAASAHGHDAPQRKAANANGHKKPQQGRGKEKTPAPQRTESAPTPQPKPAAPMVSEVTQEPAVAEPTTPPQTTPAEHAEKSGNGQRRRGGRGRSRAGDAPAPATASAPVAEVLPMEDPLADELVEGLQHVPFEELDPERLAALSHEAVARLVEPIVGTPELIVTLEESRVNVRVDCGEDSGLLIGREGQTLASLQYLASRMVSRAMNAAVRVQLDAGEYRLRQDEKLREMALALAEKVRATGKAHSTRPLSSYHRRIVHVALQDASDVQTRSSGDGPLKRVVVQRKKH